jgi:hypothetical protein
MEKRFATSSLGCEWGRDASRTLAITSDRSSIVSVANHNEGRNTAFVPSLFVHCRAHETRTRVLLVTMQLCGLPLEEPSEQKVAAKLLEIALWSLSTCTKFVGH